MRKRQISGNYEKSSHHDYFSILDGYFAIFGSFCLEKSGVNLTN